MEKWFGDNEEGLEGYAHLAQYAWAVVYLYILSQCLEAGQPKDTDRLRELTIANLIEAKADAEQINHILWDAHGVGFHDQIRSVLWSKDHNEVAAYCWVNGRNALRSLDLVSGSRLMLEIFAHRPSYIFGKIRHLFTR